MAIPESFIQELNDRADIVELVGRFVPLKKAGANFQGLCPFHDEKSPSFSVSPSKQFYHCFGCGAHGGALRFLMEYQGLGFIDAVKDLAGQLGMQVPEDQRSPQERERDAQLQVQRKTLAEVMAQAADAYVQALKRDTAAQDYLKGRGLTGQIAARFKIGWAGAGKPLAGVFADYTDPLLEESGMVIAGDEGRRYDRFRERIMFPIRNLKGEVIAFGGRIMGKGEPKYLNSPETPLFHKGREIYGLFEGRSSIQQAGMVLVTEGYMDVVALAQHGIGHAVATLGTACTPEHVQKLFRFTEQIIFSFDGDKAGQKAARRALGAVLPYASDTRVVKFLFLPTEHDPDSFVRQHGADAFDRLVHNAMPLSRFIVEAAREDCDMASTEGRSRFVSLIKPQWALLPDGAFKRQLLGQIAELAHLGQHELLELWGLLPAAEKPYQKKSYSGRFDGEKGQNDWKKPWQKREAMPNLASLAASRRKPHSRDDRAAQLLLTHMAAWDALSPAQHTVLCQLPEPHGSIMRWLEEQLQEEGPQPWPVLATQLPAAWGDTARQLVERLPDATHRHKLLSSQAPAMLASDLQELGFIVLDMELDTQQVLSADYAAQAGQDPSPDNMAALMAAQARIKTLQTEKTLLLQQQRGKP
jgi:DNA primase